MIQKASDSQFNSIYLSETVVVGSDFHRRDGKQSSVVFVDRNVGLEKVIVDSTGKIRNFPGIIKESFWYNEVSAQRLQPRVSFRLSFEKRDNMWVVLWTVQPDGRYWADDDGFGAEKEEEIVLYTYLNMEGKFTSPFRIYRKGNRCYSLERFKMAYAKDFNRAVQEIRSGERQSRWTAEIFPPLFRSELTPFVQLYSFIDKAQAIEFWNDPVLSKCLLEITDSLLCHNGPIYKIIGFSPLDGLSSPDKILHASVSLFYLITGESVFKAVLDKFYDGLLDDYTQSVLSAES